MNVAVVRDAGGVVDDSAIQRMTIGAVMRTPFGAQAALTTPRRPLRQRYYMGGQFATAYEKSASIPSSGSNTADGFSLAPATIVAQPLAADIKHISLRISPKSLKNVAVVATSSSSVGSCSGNSCRADRRGMIADSSFFISPASVSAPPAVCSVVVEPVIEVKSPWIRAL